MFKLRTVLEWISLPFFVFLVVHMGGHGALSLFGGHHDHAPHAESHTAHEYTHGITSFLNEETLVGVLLLLVFVWAWHRPALARLVPCRHQACQHHSPWPHVLATVAFVFHFFPEAHLRAEFLHHPENLLSLAGLVAFGAHFLVDVIVSATLSFYWPKNWQKILNFSLIVLFWSAAIWSAQQNIDGLHFEGLMSIIGAFFLSMFVHSPNHALKK